MKKPFTYLVIHCSATPEGRSVTPETIRNWHTKPKPVGRGWKQVGYSDLILLDGSRHRFVKHNGDTWIDPEEITNGATGINSVSRHICYVGGMSADMTQVKDTMTQAQNAMLSSIIAECLAYAPDILICGHNQWTNKACPSFWVPRYLTERCLVKIPEKNIFTKDSFNYGSKLP
jgi:N-acetylmuramoyl-L-alanine amidase